MLSHQALVAIVYQHAKQRMQAVALGTSTRNRKRPDVAAVTHCGELVVWEIKTVCRFYEVEQAWAKYRSSCHRLILVYPAETFLSDWTASNGLLHRLSRERVGVMVWRARVLVTEQEPTRLTPAAADLEHLRRSVISHAG
jgi:DNA repair protein MmcB-like